MQPQGPASCTREAWPDKDSAQTFVLMSSELACKATTLNLFPVDLTRPTRGSFSCQDPSSNGLLIACYVTCLAELEDALWLRALGDDGLRVFSAVNQLTLSKEWHAFKLEAGFLSTLTARYKIAKHAVEPRSGLILTLTDVHHGPKRHPCGAGPRKEPQLWRQRAGDG